MRMRLAVVSAFVALTFVLEGAAVASVSAAPQRVSANPATPATVTELSKVVLNETSVNAPGFFANANIGANGVIAWAGTDSAHRLNVMTSADGLRYANKVILNDTSVNRPGVVQMSESAGKAVAIAWRGMDAGGHVNVMFDVYGARKKLVLNETTFSGPAIAVFKGNLLVAWVGEDANHSLNVLPIALSSFTPGTKTVLGQFSSTTGPSLTVVDTGPNTGVVIGWATQTDHLNLAQSTDGVTFTSALGAGLTQTSGFSPAMLHYTTEGGPEYWLAWTGLDIHNHVNIQWTAHYPLWPDPASTKTVLPEWALGGPSLGFNQGVLVAWTGTDAEHHLNVARLQGF